NWLKSTFPALDPTDAAPLQSLDTIGETVESQGLTLGRAVRWPGDNNRVDWIFPILKRPNSCSLSETDCATTVALHIYRPEPGLNGEELFRLVNKINVQGPEESFITTPLLGTASQVASVDRPAAIAQLTLLETPYDDRPWLMLEGRQKFGTTPIRYGQIFAYNPRSATVSTVLSWTSPTQKAPYFKELDGAGPPEVIVDQTVGLEPKLQGYTFIDNQPPQLKEISLLTSVYPEPPTTSNYEKALQLARSGVWSHALQMMESAQETLGNGWTPAAEAQLNLIAAHAKVAHDQTERNWSSRRQQLLAYLIDGQWEPALADLEARPISYPRLLDQLKPDFNRLWRRVEAHLDIHPTDEAAQVWGALLVTARLDPAVATDWLKEQQRSRPAVSTEAVSARVVAARAAAAKDLTASAAASAAAASASSAQARFEGLLILAKGGPSILENLTLGETADAATPIAVAAPISARYQRLVGQAQVIADPGDGWQRFGAIGDIGSAGLGSAGPGSENGGDLPLGLVGDQVWYEVRLQMVGDNRGWLTMDSADTAGMGQNALPLLGLHRFAQLQVMAWQTDGQTLPTSLTVEGARLEGGQVVLLASGAEVPHFSQSGLPALTLSSNAVQWLGAGTPLPQFVQSQARWTTALSTLTNNGTTEAYYPYLTATPRDVTGDSVPELLLRLDPNELPPALADRFSSSSWPRTLILSATGSVIYSDFNQSQSVVALLPNAPATPVGLLIHDGPRYRLRQL
ncbi:MAG: hypothetical protein AAFZ80_04455, partial [Cyanobacteria bacterium P01_A01_bin.105]